MRRSSLAAVASGCSLGCVGHSMRLKPLNAMHDMACRLGVPVDCNGTHADVPAIAMRAREFPHLRLIGDHCGYIWMRSIGGYAHMV